MKRAGHVAHMENAYRTSVGKPDESDHFEDEEVDPTVNFYQTTRNHPLYEPEYVT